MSDKKSNINKRTNTKRKQFLLKVLNIYSHFATVMCKMMNVGRKAMWATMEEPVWKMMKNVAMGAARHVAEKMVSGSIKKDDTIEKLQK